MSDLISLKDLKMVCFNETRNNKIRKKADLIEESQEPEKIPEWVEINDYVFINLKNKIDDAVKNLGPKANKSKVNYLHLQNVFKKVLNGDFSNSNDTRVYYIKNIYEKYKKIYAATTTATKDMVDVYNEVRKTFIKPKSPVDAESDIIDPDSESEKRDIAMGGKSESDEEIKGQGLKMLTPKQMIVRLPILLAQLKAGNNSQKLKTEIRKIAYSLYRSKNLSKLIYNNLMNTI